MNTLYDECPFCGQKIIKGAMRCVGCGKILKTSEEQLASLQRLKESKKQFNVGPAIKFVVVIILIGIVYYYFADQIIEFIHHMISQEK